MGLEKYIHLKPFVKIPVQYMDSECKIRTCGKHETYDNDKYCRICGGKITKQKTIFKEMVGIEDLIDNNNLYQYVEDDVMYLFSNIFFETDIITEENVFTTLTPDVINAMISEFSEKHKDDILLLEKIIKSKVKVEFGFVFEVR